MKVFFAILMLFWPVLSDATITEITVPGPSLESNMLGIASDRTVSIYLPPSYNDGSDRHYPTLYILHGIFDTNRTWTIAWDDQNPGFDTIQSLMDAGIDQNLFQEMILIVPDSDKTSHYTDSPVRGNWESFIAYDLVDYIDSHYRTLDRASSRAVAGHSMGGHGAIKLAMKHPDIFSVAYGLNPSLMGFGGDLSEENAALIQIVEVNSLEDLESVNFYVQALVAIGHSFSPNSDAKLLTSLPFKVSDGQVRTAQPGLDQWKSRMPIYMVEDYIEALKQLRGLRFDSAFEDEYSHIPSTSREFSAVLTEHGIEHTFEMYNGDHRNRLWGNQGRLYTEMLPFISSLLESQ
ncbi:MAG: alpha/beta hydrolase-fold protein [Dehalococcoidia bacterium]|jgi:S-formylglutathione hydrolase FrmB